MKQLALLIFFSILGACTPSADVTSGSSSSGKSINSEAPYIWGNKTFPKPIRLASNFNANEVASITEMGTAWKTAVENQKTFFSYGEVITSNYNIQEPDGIMGIYKATTWPSDVSNDALAITQLFGRRYNLGDPDEYVRIEHADILVNYADFSFDSTDDGQYNGYDLRTVILHELGHFLGLQHIPTYSYRPDSDLMMSRDNYKASSVMYPSISHTEVKRVPKQKDINELVNKYGISIPGGSSMAAASSRFIPKNNDPGKSIKVVIELRSNGDCIHKEDGAEIWRHQTKLK